MGWDRESYLPSSFILAWAGVLALGAIIYNLNSYSSNMQARQNAEAKGENIRFRTQAAYDGLAGEGERANKWKRPALHVPRHKPTKRAPS
ncbi:hypothetical protein DL98DRAFT_512406 [Cadophora sp. DSE1049]|nr:hypothetical protein DL98DRAFT_512406 [Cadophora sp. DSE1049]